MKKIPIGIETGASTHMTAEQRAHRANSCVVFFLCAFFSSESLYIFCVLSRNRFCFLIIYHTFDLFDVTVVLFIHRIILSVYSFRFIETRFY